MGNSHERGVVLRDHTPSRTGIHLVKDKVYTIGPVTMDSVKEAVWGLPHVPREKKEGIIESMNDTKRDLKRLMKEGGVVGFKSIFELFQDGLEGEYKEQLWHKGIMNCRAAAVSRSIGELFDENIDLFPQKKISPLVPVTVFKPNAEHHLGYLVTPGGAVGSFRVVSEGGKAEYLCSIQTGLISSLSSRTERMLTARNAENILSSRSIVIQTLVELSHHTFTVSNLK